MNAGAGDARLPRAPAPKSQAPTLVAALLGDFGFPAPTEDQCAHGQREAVNNWAMHRECSALPVPRSGRCRLCLAAGGAGAPELGRPRTPLKLNLLQQQQARQQVERVDRVIRQVASSPRPRDPDVSERPHGAAALSR